ncbi:uncharacterized protein GGS25DRAFT_487593 [Hypoxylon fragiforme]|uniref:uncharacterized protein n=1 Tax=Hypoxylon fragiforme TaxID=63214 RepID=UPI0020C6A8B7|nr:uncharacterized protein GGS25DRAFT_487593 [Hypoxylon fragiforme]KAI2610125.1 hypothetical protein GGS25DRAFT_487593 [Hypoxylon fragiforme]
MTFTNPFESAPIQFPGGFPAAAAMTLWCLGTYVMYNGRIGIYIGLASLSRDQYSPIEDVYQPSCLHIHITYTLHGSIVSICMYVCTYVLALSALYYIQVVVCMYVCPSLGLPRLPRRRNSNDWHMPDGREDLVPPPKRQNGASRPVSHRTYIPTYGTERACKKRCI